MFCSTLPDSYQDTAHQYLDNIDDITKYKLQPIIDQVIQEESRRKAHNATASGSSTINKFLMTKKYEKHCAKCGKNNHNTKDHSDTPPQKIAAEKGCEALQTKRSHDVYPLDGTKFITGTCRAASGLFFFKAEVLRKQDSEVQISVLKLNTHDLWHQRLGHANSWVIKALPAHVIGGPATGAASPPTGLCDGCEKGKAKRLPFPPSKSRAETALALIHSDLDEMSAARINGYKWTATYLDDHTRYGMMFFLKHKDEMFDTFKTYEAWAEHQTGWKLKTIHTDRGSEFLSKEQKRYFQEQGIEHQTSMPYSPQQNGRAERFQQTIINKAESMRHAAGLSDGFWKHAVGTAVHVYNMTPILKAEFLMPKEIWSGKKPDISHLRIFGCAAYVHVLKGKR